LGLSSFFNTNFTAAGVLSYRLAYDVADAEAGLNFMVGSHLRMRGSAGIRYVRIDQRLSGSITTAGGVNNSIDTAEARQDFWGVGPRLGLAGMVDLGSGFGIDGQFGGTLAVGAASSRSSRQFFIQQGANVQAFSFGADGGSSAKLVPGVDAAVALTFTQPLGGTMVFKAAAGYQFVHWFNLRGFANGESSTGSGFSLDGFFFRAGMKW
jgi:hypothetical protein